MRELSFKSQSLNQACLGKITWRKPWLNAKDYVLVAPNATNPSRALITLSAEPEAAQVNGMAYVELEQLKQLQEGDVVLVEPSTANHQDAAQIVTTQSATTQPTTLQSAAAQANTTQSAALQTTASQTTTASSGRIVVMLDTGAKSNYLSLTDRCNHRCIMCPQPPVKSEPSRLEQNLRLIALMSKDTKSVGITGGEPTVVGDDLITILQALKKRVPHAAITILTNAVKLADRNFVHKIACCQCTDLQIDVPLFAATPELHNEIVGAKTFYKTIQGLYNLASYRMDIGIRVVIHRLNYQHLTALAYFIYRNFPFVKQVSFMQMETMGYAADNIERLWIDPYDYKDELSDAVNFLRQRRMTALIYNAQLCVLNPDVQDAAVQSISEWKNISLEACQACARRTECPGFFASNAQFHSAHIHALTV